MASNHLKKSVSSILCILIIGLFFPILLYAQKTSSEEKEPWTYPSVVEQLALYPRDPYLQFVVLQLAYRETGSFGARDDSNRWINQRSIQRNRNANVDLFSIFSGGLAIQESLQLDALTAEGFVDSQPPQLSMNQQQGPTIQSHPWQEMLAGRKPKISSLAMCVPDDFLFLKFGSVSKMMEATSLIDTWGAYVVSQVHQQARSQLIVERIKRQLAVETNDLLRPVYDSMVSEFAIASSDVFFREGTDVSLLMELKEPELFRAQMDKFLLNSEKATQGAVRSESQFMGVPFTLVASPDRTVHVYSAYPRPKLHLRTNSEFALKRIIESIQGKTVEGKEARRLGASDEFAYIRTIMPEGTEEEDGLVYMSDPFIRRLMGPQVKLTQRRRLICYNHLRMLVHASLMHATEHGQFAETVGQLHESNCLPEGFGDELCRCPDGGQYS